MKNDHLLNYITAGMVALIHAAIIALGWSAHKPPEPVAIDNLTFVDLGSLEGDDKPLADGAPAPLETPPPPTEPPKKVEQKPQPKKTEPVKAVESKIKTVERDDRPADIAKAENQPETPPQQPKKPVEAPKPITEPEEPLTPTNVTPPQNKITNRSPDGVVGGGQGTNPNSKVPGNPASDHKDGDGKGKKGSADQPNGQAGGDPNQIVDGGYVQAPHVSYPARARENEEEGTVQIEFIVEPNGSVSSPRVIKSSGSRALDNAALTGIRTGKFKAKSVNGVPVRSRFKTKFDFSLD